MSKRLFDATSIMAERDRVIAERLKSIQWADIRIRLAELKASEPDSEDGQGFVILDTETTGMGGAAEPVQITLIDHTGEPRLNTYVKPGCAIEYGASKVHGISRETVRNAPTFPQVIGDFSRIVSGNIVICYNLAFDRRIIRQTIAKYQLAPTRAGAKDYECAMLKYAAFHGEIKKSSNDFRWHSLSDACTYSGIERKAEHESLVDCLATLELIQFMALAKYEKV